ncbi:MAG: hypothetical protein H6767_05635 [Candidatus Peribacteria bacterium]|nr:MAG: hypothetical protein H6767_05635 [Candidatus Peribacteria bacterium]
MKQEISRKQEQGIVQDRINFTDTDARLMQMKRKDWGVGYNPQIVTENRFILTSRVPNTANDTKELIPLLKKFQEQYERTPKSIQNAKRGCRECILKHQT